jgi:MoaA/NifB/PqqE/SkfB family radical SAM enzyme
MAIDGPYSSFKFAHHQDRIAQMKRGEQIAPLFIQLIISDLCNHDCDFCAYRMSGYTSNEWFGEKDPITGIVNNNPKRMIPYEKIVEILDDCVEMDVRAVEVTGGGEPTVHPKHREIFEDIVSRGLDGALVSNGTIMRDGTPEILSNFSWVRISIDAAYAPTYARIRAVPESFFDKSIANIERIVKARDASSTSNLIVGVGFVVTKENYKEILPGVEFFSKLGVDNIRLSAVFTPEHADYFATIYEECRDSAREAVEKFQRPDFKVFNLFGDRMQDLEDEHPEYSYCGFMNVQTYIGGDQNVYRCCNTAYNPQGFIGSIKNQSFKQLWQSNAKQDNFRKFEASSCSLCMFSQKNRVINYLISDDPTHINFV